MILRRLFSLWYDSLMKPLETAYLRNRRAALISKINGKVLEIGVGTGINFAHYQDSVEVIGIEPSPWMIQQAIRRKSSCHPNQDIRLYAYGCGDDALNQLFNENSFDVVVCTLVLCTIPDPASAIQDFKRWLKPGGQLIVLEHIRSHHPHIAKIQDLFRPLWATLADGCQLNRATDSLLVESGLRPLQQEWFKAYLPFYEAIYTKPAI